MEVSEGTATSIFGGELSDVINYINVHIMVT